jgi:site-specific recombinase XerD
MKYLINNQVVLSQIPLGPLAAHIGSFADFISAQGYALYSIHRQVRLAADFSQWLKLKGIELHRISSDHSKQYLRDRARQVQPCLGDAAALSHLLDFLRGEGVIPAEKVSVPRLTPVARRLHRKRAKLMTSALRSFLKYTQFHGEMVLDLAAAVPVVPNWSMASIPRAISPDQAKQLLDSIDQHTAVGLRDYAILLLLARLGLRSNEVALLELDAIDWNTGTFSVRSKSGLRNEFPLPFVVGKAIAAYLRDGRPVSASRRVFLRAKAPIRGFRGASAVGSIVRHALKRTGIKAPTYGTHQFRHGLATEMLRQGASLSEIGDVLGHRHPQTTMIYTKVDLEALRTLALPWPGGVL